MNRLSKCVVAFLVSITLFGCGTLFSTYEIPVEPSGTIETIGPTGTHTITKTVEVEVPMASKVKWPEEPCRHLKELTAKAEPDQELAIVLAADKACINNLEEALRLTGVKEPK